MDQIIKDTRNCPVLPCMEILIRLEEKMKAIVGNGGQTGRLYELRDEIVERMDKIEETLVHQEGRINKMERWMWAVSGGSAAVGALAMVFLEHFMKR